MPKLGLSPSLPKPLATKSVSAPPPHARLRGDRRSRQPHGRGGGARRSLPAMVRPLASLEPSLGTVLLRRTTRRMALTEEGRTDLDRCRRIRADIEQAEALVGPGRADPRAPLRVTAPVSFGQRHVAPAAVECARRPPTGSVALLLLDRVVDRVDEGVGAPV